MNKLLSIQTMSLYLSILFLSFTTSHAQSQDEFTTYKGNMQQFLIDIPTGWSGYEQMKAVTGKPSPIGMVIFSEENIAKMDSNGQLAAMKKWDTGTMSSFFVDRHLKKKRMSCNNFGKKEIKLVSRLIKDDAMFSRKRKVIISLTANPIPFGGCKGVRLKGETENKEGTRWVMDVHAASDGKYLYLFALRATKENYIKNISIYEKSMSTVLLTSIR